MVAPVIAAVGGPGLSAMAAAIKALYGMPGKIDDFLNEHIETMKSSENHTIARTGAILQMAKLGFGIGYITPVVIIAAGQFLLGNTLAAVTTLGTAATLSNPIAMTCAAIGAIYYGWGALSDVERNEILDRISKGLEIGIELIKSIVKFVTDKTKELLSSKNIEEIKKYVGSAAAVFGKTLGEVTHKVADMVGDTFNVVKKKSGEAMDFTMDAASETFHVVKKKSGEAMDMTSNAASSAYRSVSETASDTYHTVSETADGIRKKLEKPAPKAIPGPEGQDQ